MAQEDKSERYANYKSSGDEIWNKKIIVDGMLIISHQEMRYGTRR